MTFELIVVGAVKGFAAGAGAALIGYLKNTSQDEGFQPLKFTKTVVLGGIIGGVAGGLNIDPTTAEQYVAYPLVVLGIDAVVKVVARKVVTPIYEKLKSLFS